MWFKMVGFEEKFIEMLVERAGKDGKEIGEKFIEFVRKEKGKDIKTLYSSLKIEEIMKICEEFLKENNIKEYKALDIIEALKRAHHNEFLKASIKGAIPAIMAGDGGRVNSKYIRKARKKLLNGRE